MHRSKRCAWLSLLLLASCGSWSSPQLRGRLANCGRGTCVGKLLAIRGPFHKHAVRGRAGRDSVPTWKRFQPGVEKLIYPASGAIEKRKGQANTLFDGVR